MAVQPFSNEPVNNFSSQENAGAMRAAIEKIRGELGREYDLVIGGRRIQTSDKIRSVNPARPSEVVGVHQKAGREHVEPAMQAALAAFASWKNVAPQERAGLLFRVAEIIRKRKPEFNAWMVFEVGKNWDEAEADTCEAIDFCEFYARLALRMAEAEPAVQLPGERDLLRYIPLGVGAVIPPWNFPLAIMCGMTVASVVCGNTVVLKPSSDSPTIAAKFFEALEEAGLPPGVVNFCPGSGATFGNGLVEHPQTRFIAFTGSRDVGLEINVRAAQRQSGQIWIKRTILEMGGKDSIVVAADADLDAAVEGVAASAFGFQGQKCSACSRAIVDTSLYDTFLEKLQARVAKIRVGDPAENAPSGPVINAGALNTITNYIGIGAQEGRVLAGGKRAAVAGCDDGYFLEPTVIADVPPTARIAQEEIFGPVLAVIRANNFDDALAIANNTEYGLTGAF
jgi:1-pyrroline-5-carboxylate dehydrogenase